MEKELNGSKISRTRNQKYLLRNRSKHDVLQYLFSIYLIDFINILMA